ncbi:Putative tyrosine-protein kinase in cps region [bacterium YEK0313]|nr:Putative tyrosine-protein kinase in cps region [bacterium YEK0313]
MRALLDHEARLLQAVRATGAGPYDADLNAPGAAGERSHQALGRSLRTILRRWRLIAAMTAAGAMVALVTALVVQPKYTASAQIIVDQRGNDGPGATPATQPGEESAIETHVTILASEAHLLAVASALLANQSEGHVEPPSRLSRIRRAASVILQRLGLAAPSPAADTSSAAATHALALDLRRRIKVDQERRSRVITVSYSSADPQAAATVANTVVQVYLDDLALRRRVEARRLMVWLAKRIPEARLEVARAERELEAYRLIHAAASAAPADETAVQIAQLSRQLAIARSEMQSATDRLARARQLSERPGSEMEMARLLGSPLLLELVRRDAGDAMTRPAVQEELARGLRRLESEAQVYSEQARSIEQRLAPLRAAANSTADGLSGLRALERQALALGQFYDGLLRRQQEVDEQVQLVRPDARLLAAAWPPERPSSLHPAFLLPPMVIASTILGILLAFGLALTERTIRDKDDAVEVLGVPCLGTVPRLEAHRAALLSREEPQSGYARLVRSLLVSLMPTNAIRHGPQVVLLTSTGPDEGKTALAWSLTVVAARLGLKVLLVSRSRHPAWLEDVPRAAGRAAPPNGATGAASPAAAERIGDLQIDFAPAALLDGAPGLDAAEAGGRWSDRFRGAYDIIIVDDDSVGERPEVGLAAMDADWILFLVRAGVTGRAAAGDAVQFLVRASGAEASGSPRIASILSEARAPTSQSAAALTGAGVGE